jgi:hypothetical protein
MRWELEVTLAELTADRLARSLSSLWIDISKMARRAILAVATGARLFVVVLDWVCRSPRSALVCSRPETQ